MSRILGLDIGAVKTGIAISDELQLTARPLMVVPTKQLRGEIVQLMESYDIGRIVVGRPRSLDGSLGQQVAETKRIVEALQLPATLELTYEDETATTVENGTDDAAACGMLRGYLAEHR
jgi:putative Holliday junction resolvase